MAQLKAESDFQNCNFQLKNKLVKDIAVQFQNEEFSDLTIVVDSKRFCCHKAIMAARSEYFKALVLGNWKESHQSEVELKDISAEAFHLLLKYIYTSELDLTNLMVESIFDVFQVVHKYRFEELEPQLLNYLEKIVDSSNVLMIFEMAFQFSLKSLIEICDKYIMNRTSEIIKSPTFVELPMPLFKNLWQRNVLFIEELEIFRAIKKWIEHNRQTTTDDDVQAVLSLVRLSHISSKDLVNVVWPTKLYPEGAIVEAIKIRLNDDYGNTNFRAPEPIKEENVAALKYGSEVLVGNRELMDRPKKMSDSIEWIPDEIETDITNIHTNAKIMIKLGKEFIVNCIKIEQYSKAKIISFTELEVSHDGRTWFPITAFQKFTCDVYHMICLPAIATKYVRIFCDKNFQFSFDINFVECMYSEFLKLQFDTEFNID